MFLTRGQGRLFPILIENPMDNKQSWCSMIGGSFTGATLAVLGAICFGVNILLVRKITVTGEALDAVMATVWMNVIVFSLLSFIFYYPKFEFTRVSLFAFSFSGLLGTFLGRLCWYSGTKEIGASRTTPITQANLLVATVFSVLVLGELVTLGHWIGVCALLGGVIIVSYEIESDDDKSSFGLDLRILLPLGAMTLFGLEAPLGKIGLLEETPVLAGLALKSFAAFLGLTGLFLAKGDSPLRPFRAEQKNLYILSGLIQTTGFGLVYLALSISRVVVVVPFRSMTPFFVMILSYAFLRRLEEINKYIVLGSLLVVGGATVVGLYM
ncbi:hypothetical protein AKJ40_02320 [candidate division MSBL1 archaeon SCGC-AAA259M10]|uniref:EamA domain-containing protein n=1 Tax=candidate division MSBL1 archaeon SCGC-AAA259M10 TaxID=1698270 RepID=A0A133V084_9EURY|nr:hypothetical protein AKJ40_02320 [candidate division MSBL1 archaeon SCGC-AAA259M10]